MESELLKMAMSQGIWAVLSIFLIVYILKIQEKRDAVQDEREKNYCTIINQLTGKMNLINYMNTNVELLKEKICEDKK